MSLLNFSQNQKRREEKFRPSFRFVHELRSVVNEDIGPVFLSIRLQSKLLEIIENWVTGITFMSVRIGYLARFIGRGVCPTGESWSLTANERGILFESLFTDLVKLMDKIFVGNLEFMPRLLEIGNLAFEDFMAFLKSAMIPFVGPFRLKNEHQIVPGATTVVLEISSLNALDTKMNGGVPLYGFFDFHLHLAGKQEEEIAQINEYQEVPDGFMGRKHVSDMICSDKIGQDIVRALQREF